MRDTRASVTIDLKVADATVGTCAWPPASMLRTFDADLVTTLIASEVERVRAPERASEEAATAFLRAVLRGEIATATTSWRAARARHRRLERRVGGRRPRASAQPDGGYWRPATAGGGGRGARSIGPVRSPRPVTRTPAPCWCWSRTPTVTRPAGPRDPAANGVGLAGLCSRWAHAGWRPRADLQRAGDEAIPRQCPRTTRGGLGSRLRGLPATARVMSDPAELKRLLTTTPCGAGVYNEQ